MAMDATLFSRGGRAPGSTSDPADGDRDVAVRRTVAEAVRVTLPQGQRTIAIPVTPGDRVVLPTDSGEGLLAELGPQGNLAIVVDGRTIILQGYAAANEESRVTIVTNEGEPVDVAAVIAETDPSIDIQTAAGPATGSPGDTAAGGGIFVPFPEGVLLGGFDAAGVLGGTALAYKLITDQTKTFDLDDDEERGSGIENALPEANPDSATVAQAAATDYQLMLVIDVSGSMAERVVRPDGTATTRMELQKAATIDLLESYAAAASGSVNIKLVKFSNDAAYFGGTGASEFVDITDAAGLAAVIAAINALRPTQNTDYDAALATAQLGIMDSSWVATTATTKGLVYFFSDGVPVNDGDQASSYPGGDKANALNQTEENLWEGRTSAGIFTAGLADKGVVSIAVGLGADIAGEPSGLQQLGRAAYYNEAFPDQPVIVVNDENQLAPEIVQTAPGTVTGNVLTNDDPGADGFGDPRIIAVSAIFDADTTSGTLTDTVTGYKVETNNGVLVIDKTTGAFSYTAAPGSGGHEDSFTYTIQDGSPGDTDSATLTVTIAQPAMVAGATPSSGTDGNDFIIGDDAGNFINAAAGNDSVQGGYGDDQVDGGAGNDALYGQEGDDSLGGDAGDDALFGGNGTDALDGGSGVDSLSGGAGNDLLDGGEDGDTDFLDGWVGDDTLIWRGPEDTYDGGADLFDAANGAAGDVLDAGNAAGIDFTMIGDGRIADLETVRLTGGAGTSVALNAADVIADLEGGLFDPLGNGPGGSFGRAPILRIDGDAGDTLALAGGGWFAAAGAGGFPAGFRLYVHESSGALPGASEDAYALAQDPVAVTGV